MKLTVEEMAELYEAGWSLRRIAAQAGVSHPTVRRLLDDAGVAIRCANGAGVSITAARAMEQEAAAWRLLLREVLVAVGRHPPPQITLPAAQRIVERVCADRAAQRPRVATRAVELGGHAWLTIWVEQKCVGRLVLGVDELADIEARLCDRTGDESTAGARAVR